MYDTRCMVSGSISVPGRISVAITARATTCRPTHNDGAARESQIAICCRRTRNSANGIYQMTSLYKHSMAMRRGQVSPIVSSIPSGPRTLPSSPAAMIASL